MRGKSVGHNPKNAPAKAPAEGAEQEGVKKRAPHTFTVCGARGFRQIRSLGVDVLSAANEQPFELAVRRIASRFDPQRRVNLPATRRHFFAAFILTLTRAPRSTAFPAATVLPDGSMALATSSGRGLPLPRALLPSLRL